MNLSSYPKVHNVGHPSLAGFFAPNTDISVEEKIDGSQFSFGVKDGELFFRSKNQRIYVGNEGMFKDACDKVRMLHGLRRLRDGWVYRGEFLSKPKHNVLKYDRVPDPINVILFDIMVGPEEYLGRFALEDEGRRLGVEVVPVLYYGPVESAEQVQKLLGHESCLGGVTVEGLVFKRRVSPMFGRDDKPLIAKYVSERFREKASGVKLKQPRQEILAEIEAAYRKEARWEKAAQHMREAGILTMSPRDIGPLIQETIRDFELECADEIGQLLWKHFRREIVGRVTKGIPEWYKDKLLKEQCED